MDRFTGSRTSRNIMKVCSRMYISATISPRPTPVGGIRKGMADNEMWCNREWSATIQVKGADPVELTGYWSAIKVLEGDTSKIQMGPGT
jgi:hypothetical protein